MQKLSNKSRQSIICNPNKIIHFMLLFDHFRTIKKIFVFLFLFFRALFRFWFTQDFSAWETIFFSSPCFYPMIFEKSKQVKVRKQFECQNAGSSIAFDYASARNEFRMEWSSKLAVWRKIQICLILALWGSCWNATRK